MNEFLKELKALLSKHNATIGFDVDDCSDLHGVYGEHIFVTVGEEVKDFKHSWSLDASDIDD